MRRGSASIIVAFGLLMHGSGFAQDANPLLPENSTVRVSDHVYVIPGFPNVGIIVGADATLVVDTGLGRRNGAIVAKEAQKLAKGSKLYLTTTHFHPEHAAGDAGFPADTIVIRPRIQQQELERDGDAVIQRFRERPAFAPFLETVSYRKPDISFDDEYQLNLGGLNVRLMWLGPAHTRGDEEIFVVEDRTLLTGDLAMKDRPPTNFAEGSSAKTWLAILEKLAALQPLHVVPDHGPFGDASLITEQRAVLSSR